MNGIHEVTSSRVVGLLECFSCFCFPGKRFKEDSYMSWKTVMESVKATLIDKIYNKKMDKPRYLYVLKPGHET